MSRYAELHNEGQSAFVKYAVGKAEEALGRVSENEIEGYADPEIVARMRESFGRFSNELENGDISGLAAVINKNPILDFILGISSEHLLLNQDKVSEFFRKLTGKKDSSLEDKGYHGEMLLTAITKARQRGLFGAGSGTSYVFDKVIRDLPVLVNTFLPNSSGGLVARMLIESSGLTPEKISEAYIANGIKGPGGLIDFLTSTATESPAIPQFFELAKLKIQELINKSGKKIDLSGINFEECVQTQRLYGFDEERGLANLVLTSIYKNSKGLGGNLYSRYVKRFVQEDGEKVQDIFEKGLGFKITSEQRTMQKSLKAMPEVMMMLGGFANLDKNNLNKLLKDFAATGPYLPLIEFAKKHPPVPLKDGNLLTYVENHGIIGEDGAFAYVGRNMPKIMEPFVRAGIVTSAEVADMQERYEEASRVTSATELNIAYKHLIIPTFQPAKDRKGSPYIELAELASKEGVTPSEFLADPVFNQEKIEWMKKYKLYIEKDWGALSGKIDRAVNTDNWVEELAGSFKDGLAGNIGKSIVSYLNYQSKRDPAYKERIKDYARLGRDFISEFSLL